MSKKLLNLRPFVSSGEPIVRNNGDVESVPMQLWRQRSGGVVLRIGESCYFFNEQGKYDGSEHKGSNIPPYQMERLTEMLEQSGQNRGRTPSTTYHQPGSNGWEDEVASIALHQSTGGEGSLYRVKPPESESN